MSSIAQKIKILTTIRDYKENLIIRIIYLINNVYYNVIDPSKIHIIDPKKICRLKPEKNIVIFSKKRNISI